MTRRGSVLLYVVWVVILLSLFSAGVAGQAMFALDLSERLAGQMRAIQVARGALQYAQLSLERDESASVDDLSEMWSNDPGRFRERALGEGVFTLTDGGDGRHTRYGMADEERRLPLNTATAPVLARLCERVGGLRPDQAAQVADAIVDWRDEDDERQPHGAEDFDYRGRTLYESKDAPFQNVEELLLVDGMTVELYQRLLPHVTVHGSGAVNLNTAGPEVLAALGLTTLGVDGMELYRAGGDAVEGTSDDQRLTAIAAMESELAAYVPPEELVRLVPAREAELLGVGSTAFRFRVAAEAGGSQTRMSAEAIIGRDGALHAWSVR
ncbi:MAG: type II secretion system protein GspK [Dehalococcoidia bacterium]|nr:type II secretion system protein GspK [Dehalococcoidia bacterium]